MSERLRVTETNRKSHCGHGCILTTTLDRDSYIGYSRQATSRSGTLAAREPSRERAGGLLSAPSKVIVGCETRGRRLCAR